MRILIIILLSTLFYNCSNSNKYINSLNLKGVFNSYMKSTYIITLNQKSLIKHISEVSIYNKNGLLITSIKYFPNNTFYTNIIKCYNQNGLLTNFNKYNPDGSLSFRQCFMYKYTNLTESFLYNSDYSLRNKTYYKYNDSGLLIERIINSANGIVLSKQSYKYDLNNNKIETIEYDPSDTLRLSYRNKYSNGNLIESHDFNANLNSTSIRNYQYDKHGIQSDHYETNIEAAVTNTSHFIHNNSYDIFGRITKQLVSDDNNNIYHIYEFKYHLFGYLLEIKTFLNNNILESVTIFKYDSIGNRIEERVYSSNNVNVSITEYRFDYINK